MRRIIANIFLLQTLAVLLPRRAQGGGASTRGDNSHPGESLRVARRSWNGNREKERRGLRE